MKISYNWLKDYINIDYDAVKVAEMLTAVGLEVEGVENWESVQGGLNGVVIGKVISCSPVEGSDHLKLTKVDVGDDVLLQIVCGASNVAEGQLVPVATVGTDLFNQKGEKLTIKKAKIRGVESYGMICAEDELGLGNSHDGILVLKQDAKVGMLASEYFGVQNDTVFEIGITPNRSDATSHIGVARDLFAAIKALDPDSKVTFSLPDVSGFKKDGSESGIVIEIKDDHSCPRYSGVTLAGLNIGETPKWIVNRLNAVGLRSINAVVDITQYVMLETGHPLHAFDLDQVKGNKIIVQKLPDQTDFITLDGVSRKLSSEDLMICNESEGMCMAGVFGGLSSGVSAVSNAIFIESAYFEPSSIRRSSKRHGLKTDASFRFERGADPDMTIYAAKRAALLVQEIVGAKITSDIIDVNPHKIQRVELNFDLDKMIGFVGDNISECTTQVILESLGFEILKKDQRIWSIAVPLYKTDVTRQADVVEEVIRILGYNRIRMNNRMQIALRPASKPDYFSSREQLSDLLCALGYSEIMCNSLSKEEYYRPEYGFDNSKLVHIMNPLSRELNIMRMSMLFGGLESISYNSNRKNPNLKFFEWGRVYQQISNAKEKSVIERFSEKELLSILISGKYSSDNWNQPDEESGFYHIKSAVDSIIQKMALKNIYEEPLIDATILDYGLKWICNDIELAYCGQVKKSILKQMDIQAPVFYAEIDFKALVLQAAETKIQYKDIPKYPEMRRDLSLFCPIGTSYRDIQSVISSSDKKLLRRMSLFDVYQDDAKTAGKVSYSISLYFGLDDRTLADHEVDASIKTILVQLEEKLKVQIR